MSDETKYHLAWQGDTGIKVGRRLTFTKEEGDARCVELNAEDPTRIHFLVPQGEVPEIPDIPVKSEVVPYDDGDLMPFGVHGAKPMRSVPAQYLDWLQGQPSLMQAWPRLEAYIAKNRGAIDQDLRQSGALE